MPPAPGQRCLVCNHPAVVLITRLINEGVSDRKVAGQFGLKSHAPVRNHRVARHPGVTVGEAPAIPDVGDLPEDAGPRERLAHLAKQLEAQAAEGDVRPELAREIRLTQEALAKIGSPEPPPVVQVKDVVGLRELFDEMHRALDRWPEARDAVADIWRRRSGDG